MSDNKERKIVNFVLDELFASDGPLRAGHDFHIKPSERMKIKSDLRHKVREQFNVPFNEDELSPPDADNLAQRLYNSLKNS